MDSIIFRLESSNKMNYPRKNMIGYFLLEHLLAVRAFWPNFAILGASFRKLFKKISEHLKQLNRTIAQISGARPEI